MGLQHRIEPEHAEMIADQKSPMQIVERAPRQGVEHLMGDHQGSTVIFNDGSSAGDRPRISSRNVNRRDQREATTHDEPSLETTMRTGSGLTRTRART